MPGDDLKSRIDFLEEERKKDKAALKKLTDKLTTADAALDGQAKTLKEMGAQVAHLSARLQPTQVEEIIARYRDETAREMAAMEKRRMDLEAQNARSRTVDRDRIDKTVNDIHARLTVLDAMRDSVDARKEEQNRQALQLQDMRKILDTVKQRDDERARILAAAEEGRRQDIRRMADIQGEQQAIRQKSSEGDARGEALESGLRRLEGKIADLLASELDRRNALSVWQEQQTGAAVDLERHWKEWERKVSASVAQMDAFLGQMDTYSEMLRSMRQALADNKEMAALVDQRMKEMAEVQRIQEDRLRQDWATFLADDQKRWTAQNLAREDEWREHDRQFGRALERLTRMEEKVDSYSELVRSAQEGDRARLEALANQIREWLARIPQTR